MTLCAVWSRTLPSNEPQLVMATDSRITGGFTYDFGTKLSVFNRRDCSICWHGDTTFPYSFVANARSDIDFSDALSTRATGIDAVQKRILDIFNDLWSANLNDPQSQYKADSFGFLFGGYDWRLGTVRAWNFCQDVKQNRQLLSIELDAGQLSAGFFVGSQAQLAQTTKSKSPGASPFAVLRDICQDNLIRDVGGYPQVVTIDRRGAEAIGVCDAGRRYLFGKNVNSSGHWTQVRYIDVTAGDV